MTAVLIRSNAGAVFAPASIPLSARQVLVIAGHPARGPDGSSATRHPRPPDEAAYAP
jgi:hypothetical protein